MKPGPPGAPHHDDLRHPFTTNCIESGAISRLWCPGQDSNLHAVKQRLLRPSCLPFHHPGREARHPANDSAASLRKRHVANSSKAALTYSSKGNETTARHGPPCQDAARFDSFGITDSAPSLPIRNGTAELSSPSTSNSWCSVVRTIRLSFRDDIRICAVNRQNPRLAG
jgi:hypothetical protein